MMTSPVRCSRYRRGRSLRRTLFDGWRHRTYDGFMKVAALLLCLLLPWTAFPQEKGAEVGPRKNVISVEVLGAISSAVKYKAVTIVPTYIRGLSDVVSVGVSPVVVAVPPVWVLGLGGSLHLHPDRSAPAGFYIGVNSLSTVSTDPGRGGNAWLLTLEMGYRLVARFGLTVSLASSLAYFVHRRGILPTEASAPEVGLRSALSLSIGYAFPDPPNREPHRREIRSR